MKDKILIQAWTVYKSDNSYYIQHSHAAYINSIKKFYKQIYLISPVNRSSGQEVNSYSKLDESFITILELPYIDNYFKAYKYFFNYIRLYSSIRNLEFDTVYSRFPNPFGWLQMFYYNEDRVVHYVGDPIDTVLKNSKINPFIKYTKVFLFIPEYVLFLLSSLKADKVFTNGHHIANKLKKLRINAKPLISTTLTEEDLFNKDSTISINNNCIKLLYVGYLRKAKGVDILINALNILNRKYPNKFSLTIVGSGEEAENLIQLASKYNVKVEFTGHIDDREQLNSVMRKHDIFCFASLSEGSPRVILEALASGLFVITTPVGSLPYVFKENIDLLYFDFNNAISLSNQVLRICGDVNLQRKLRSNIKEKIKTFKIDNFIQEAFNA